MNRIRFYLGLLLCLSVFAYLGAACDPVVISGEKKLQDSGSTDTHIKPGCSSDAECTTPGLTKCVAGSCAAECTTDGDCKDPTKPKCINGTCDGLPGCGTDEDCKDPAKPICQSGSCVSKPPSGCKDDSECKPDEQCKEGKCISKPPVGCKDDSECKPNEQCKEGKCISKPPTGCKNNSECPKDQECKEGNCVPKPPIGCKDDSECKPDEQCKESKCVPKPPIGCKDDSECKPDEECKESKCVPKPPIGCKRDDDCSEPTKPKCDQGTGKCLPLSSACKSDSECKDPSMPKCIGGLCQPECKTSADCQTPGKAKCTNGTCQPECQTSTDCKDPSKPVCQNGTCTPKSGCKSDKECISFPTQMRCELSSGKCVSCVVDAHCKAWQVCDTAKYTCVLKPGACNADPECKNPNEPYCTNHVCVACRSHANCPALHSCLAGKCVNTGCASDTDCAAQPGKHCLAAKKKCVACTFDSHCSSVQFCDTSSYTCQAKATCSKDADCKAPTSFCDLTTKVCVACTSSSQCKKDPHAVGAALCDKGQCLGCSADKDCSLGYLCNAGSCVEGCKSARDCPTSAKICSTVLKKCVACASNSDCASGACDLQTGKCSYKCTAKDRYDQGCRSRGLPSFCDALTKQCVACIPRKYSASYTSDIGCNQLKPRCEPTSRKCVLCLEDKDCTFGAGATKATCDKKTYSCTECKVTNDCRRGYVCNQSGRCIIGCSVDTDCPRGKICGDSNRCVECSSKKPKNCATGLVCDAKVNSCVQCLKDSDCGPAQKCDLSINKCLGATGRTQCFSCTKDSECAAGHACKKTKLYNSTTSTEVETVCLKKCTSSAGCGTGYTCCSRTNRYCDSRFFPQRDGYCYPKYGTGGSTREGYTYARSCKGKLTVGKSCTVKGYTNSCGNGGVTIGNFKRAEALCDISAKICRLPCSVQTPCESGYTCGCPSGATLRSNGYCYIGNIYYVKRCIK